MALWRKAANTWFPRVREEHLWQAMRTMCACTLAYGASGLTHLPESYWSVITAVVVTHPKLDETLSTGRDQFLGAVLGAIVGAAGIELVRLGAPHEPVFWAILAPLALISAVVPAFRLSCTTLVIVLLIPFTGNPFLRARDRVFAILIGTLAALAVTAAIARIRPPSSVPVTSPGDALGTASPPTPPATASAEPPRG